MTNFRRIFGAFILIAALSLSATENTYLPGIIVTGPNTSPDAANRFAYTPASLAPTPIPAPAPSTPPPSASNGATLLFATGFEGNVALASVTDCSANPPSSCWQDIVGTDTTTGFSFPMHFWGLAGGPYTHNSSIQMIMGNSETITAANYNDYMHNEIQTVAGHNGNQTRALYQEITVKDATWVSSGGGVGNTQDNFVYFPAGSGNGDLYISYWEKLQPDFATVVSGTFRCLTETKAGSGHFRMGIGVNAYGSPPHFYVSADTYSNAGGWTFNGNGVIWQLLQGSGLYIPTVSVPTSVFHTALPPQYTTSSTKIPMPTNWFHVETFWHRDATSGRYWAAINGQLLIDYHGDTIGDSTTVNRIYPFMLYSGGSAKAYQWVDDLEIWDGFPTTASAH
jgi:hypothetical protein